MECTYGSESESDECGRRREVTMKKLFLIANRYIETSDWKMIAVLKFCLISLGLMAGMSIKDKHRKKVFPVAIIVFFLTYIPLMYKFFKVFQEENGRTE